MMCKLAGLILLLSVLLEGAEGNQEQQPTCRMSENSNLKITVALYSTESAINFDECKAKCLKDPKCKATELRSDQCQFYTNIASSSSGLAGKQCDDQGDQEQQPTCRMSENSNLKITVALYSTESANSFDECKAKCLKDLSCKATELRSGQCQFYTNIASSSSGLAGKQCDDLVQATTPQQDSAAGGVCSTLLTLVSLLFAMIVFKMSFI